MPLSALLHEDTVGTGEHATVLLTPRGDVDAVAFAHEAGAFIEERLQRAGAIVFRGFGIDGASRLDAFARAISPETPTFSEESSPRSQVLGAVYTSTDHPKAYPIQFHNEYSYASEWPLKIYFACELAAKERGATPIADTRRILARLSADTRRRFLERRILYVRHFIPGMGVAWQKAFRTDDKQAVERYCASAGIELSWDKDDSLTTRQLGDAIVRHPRTKEEVWFNHGWFFNVEGLEPQSLRAYFQRQPEDTLSTNTYYGDGSRIDAAVFDELRQAYLAETRRFDWQNGDVLLIDNMLTSHSREPYAGERKILCVMADPCRRAEIVIPET